MDVALAVRYIGQPIIVSISEDPGALTHKQFLMCPCNKGVGNILALQVRYVSYCPRGPWHSAAEALGLERCAITWVAGTAGHIFGLTVLLYTDDVRAIQTNLATKLLKQCLCNLKMVQA